MRGMFSILFGAGILLFTGRSPSNSGAVTDLFFRRLMWLVLFGIIHCYLILWIGEILYAYGLVGMFAFSFRHLPPRKLIMFTSILLLLASLWNVNEYYSNKGKFHSAAVANEKKQKGESLSKEEAKAITAWDEVTGERKPGQEKITEEIEALHQGYWSIVMYRVPGNQFMETLFIYRLAFFDTLAMMLLGMAFFKLGIIKAEKSNRYYGLMVVIGYAIGLPVNYYETNLMLSHQFSILAIDQGFITYNVGRVANTCGHIGVIMLFIKSAWLPSLQKALAAVGQMAFTNYIMQSVICNFIFMGYGLAQFGEWQRYQLYYVVFGIWAFQLILSPIWLKYFRFGPLEWLWRSLTYWEKQSFVRQDNIVSATIQ